VLVVDDEPMIRELVVDALRESGFEVQSAGHGLQALEVLRGWVPRVIVLDLMMPKLDGVGFTESLRSEPRLASIPVLLVTAAYAPHDMAERTGARAVLSSRSSSTTSWIW
jgi:CheY-like chemotaxis protein